MLIISIYFLIIARCECVFIAILAIKVICWALIQSKLRFSPVQLNVLTPSGGKLRNNRGGSLSTKYVEGCWPIKNIMFQHFIYLFILIQFYVILEFFSLLMQPWPWLKYLSVVENRKQHAAESFQKPLEVFCFVFCSCSNRMFISVFIPFLWQN